MFSLDPHLAAAELRQLSENFDRLTPDTRENIRDVMNMDHSDEFYRGMAAALYAAAKLITDTNYPESMKHTVLAGSLGFVAAKLTRGSCPTD